MAPPCVWLSTTRRSWPPPSSIIARTLTRSLERSRQTPASAPGLLGRRRDSSVRIMRRAYQRTNPVEETAADRPIGCGRPSTGTGQTLREDLDDDAAVLRASGLRLVRRNRLLGAVADHADLVERNLILLVQIPLNGLGAL